MITIPMNLYGKRLRFSTILIAVLFFTNLTGQVPNGGFEDWELTGFHEKPVYWTTNQDSVFARMEKDSIFKVEGKYALRLFPSSLTAWTDCNSIAKLQMALPSSIGPNKSLYLYARSLLHRNNTSGNTFLRIIIKLYEKGKKVSSHDWESHRVMSQFEKFEFPISHDSVDSLSVVIIGGAVNGPADGCLDPTISWIDGISIDRSSSTGFRSDHLNSRMSLAIWPNPVAGREIYVQSSTHNIQSIDLINSQGISTTVKWHPVKSGLTLIVDTDNLPGGLYTCCIRYDGGHHMIGKVHLTP